MRNPLLPAATAGLLATLASCAVYVPTVPLTPMVREAGQADISGGLYLPAARAEASVVYAPVAHVLLTGALAGAPRLGGESSLAQYDVGAGLYQPLGERWVLSGLGGFGQAHSRRATTLAGLTLLTYEATYSKVFGQLAIARTTSDFSYGFTYRLNSIRFSDLREVTDGPIALSSMLRHELAFNLCTQLGRDPRLQLNGTFGLTFADGYRTDPYGSNLHVEAQRGSDYLVGLGVTYRLGHRAE